MGQKLTSYALPPPLVQQAFRGNVKEVREILSTPEGKADVNKCDVRGRSPLFVAARAGHVEVCELLLRNGADVEQTSQKGRTPLYGASSRGGHRVVKLLLDHGAVVNHTTREGLSPLLQSAKKGSVESLEELLTRGADAKHTDAKGVSALWFAAARGNPTAVKLLLEHGANMNQAQQNGSTPLCVAAGNGHLEVVRLALESGANVNQANDNGSTPLFFAASKGRLETVKLLVEHGGDGSLRGVKSETPAQAARQRGHTEVERYLRNPDQHRKSTRLSSFLDDGARRSVKNSVQYDVFLTHDWGTDADGRENHQRVVTFKDALVSRGLVCWLDEVELQGHIMKEITNGIDSSSFVLVFVTQRYADKVNGDDAFDYCQREFNYATQLKKPMMAVVCERQMIGNTWKGNLGATLGPMMYANYAQDAELNTAADQVASRVRAL